MKTPFKYRYILLLVFALFIALFPNCHAYASGEEKKEDILKVYNDKIWYIRFDKPLDLKYINKDNIRIFQEEGDNFNNSIKFEYDDEYNVLYVIPLRPYSAGKSYCLAVGNLYYKDGNKVNSQVFVRFNTYNSKMVFANNYSDYCAKVASLIKEKDRVANIIVNEYSEELYNNSQVEKLMDQYKKDDTNYACKVVYVNSDKTKTRVSIVLEDEEYENYQEEQGEVRSRLVELEIKKILGNIIKSGMSDAAKVKAVHDYLVSNSDFDKSYYDSSLTNIVPDESFNEYGALVNGSAVSSGYSLAMQRLLREAGVECLCVNGYLFNGFSMEMHVWNIVKENNNFYHVDVCLDDINTKDNKDIKHDYCNLIDDKIFKDHYWDITVYPQCK